MRIADERGPTGHHGQRCTDGYRSSRRSTCGGRRGGRRRSRCRCGWSSCCRRGRRRPRGRTGRRRTAGLRRRSCRARWRRPARSGSGRRRRQRARWRSTAEVAAEPVGLTRCARTHPVQGGSGGGSGDRRTEHRGSTTPCRDAGSGPAEEPHQSRERHDGEEHHREAHQDGARVLTVADQHHGRGVDEGGDRLIGDQRRHPPEDLGQPALRGPGHRTARSQHHDSGEDDDRPLAEDHDHGLDETREHEEQAEHDDRSGGVHPLKAGDGEQPLGSAAPGCLTQHPDGEGVSRSQGSSWRGDADPGPQDEGEESSTCCQQRVRSAREDHLDGLPHQAGGRDCTCQPQDVAADRECG
ncbi:hypothetical protein F1641_11875 [Quadrisphaera sp. INWT6]|nr:hypothetical protein [Quadrisphaera sp. INWT6]